jgi:hypothetical protein
VKRVLLALIGSAVLAAFSIAALPFSRGLFRVPRTPYDAGDAAPVVPSFILLQRADSLIPRGASVVVRSGSSDPTADTYLHRFAVGLLPGRKIVPAALWGVATEPGPLREADYEIVVGQQPTETVGRLVLEIPEGTVWKRDR